MATAKRKKLLAAAIILQLKRSRKRSEKWDNRKIWSKTWISFLRRLPQSLDVASKKHGLSDHSVIKLTSFSSVQKQFSMSSAVLKSHVIISLP